MIPNHDKRKKLTDNFYWLNLQNLSGRENPDEAFYLGVMTGVDELTEWVLEHNSSHADKFHKSLELLRELADLQNGPPLETYKKDWEETMHQVYSFLNEWEED